MTAIPKVTNLNFTQQNFEDRSYMSSKSAAIYLDRTSPAWLQDRHRNPSHPPYYRLGSRVLYKRSDLDNWVEKQWELVGGKKS